MVKTKETQPLVIKLGQSADPEIVGGKAAPLSVLFRHGFDVPGGYIITTRAVDELSSKPISTSISVWNEIEKAHMEMFGSDTRVSVRSSAVIEDNAAKSYAGYFDSILDVNYSSLRQAVRDVIKSKEIVAIQEYKKDFFQQALRKGIGVAEVVDLYKSEGLSIPDLPFAVLVQQYVTGEKSGILMTGDDLAEDINVMRLSVAEGPNANVTSGRTGGSTYWITKFGDVIKAREAYQSTTLKVENGTETLVKLPYERLIQLSVLELKRIAEMGRILESRFGCSQDIEFIIQDRRIVILQSRPIPYFATAKNAKAEGQHD